MISKAKSKVRELCPYGIHQVSVAILGFHQLDNSSKAD